MSSFQGLSSVTGLSSFVNQGVAPSVTPSPALNWTATLYCDGDSPCQDYTEERIQGIGQNITLAFSVSASSGTPPTVYFRKSSTITSSDANYCDANLNFSYSAPVPEGRITAGQFGQTSLYNGSSLVTSSVSVAANDYLTFIALGNALPFPPATHTVTIEIRNSSDGNALLDTIIFQQP